jgi:regulatory protein
MEDQDRLKNYFFNIIAKKDYTRAELFKKARLRKYDNEVINMCLDELENSFLIDDKRYAENYIFHKSQVKGRGWIEIKLRQKGIDKETIQNLFEETEVDTDEIIIKKVDSKYAKTDFTTLEDKDKAKIYRYIMSQGFRISYGGLKTVIEGVIKRRSQRLIL